MFRHFLLVTLKHLWKRRLYSFISLLSLSLGLSVFSLVVLHVKRELSYNQGWPDSERIYRLYREQEGSSQSLVKQFNEGDILELQNFLGDQVEGYTEYSMFSTRLDDDPELNAGLNLALVDETFVDVFPLEAVEGSLEQVMENPGLIALSQQTAEALMGEQSSYVGRSLTFSGARFVVFSPDFVPGEAVEFEVGAIYTLPQPLSSPVSFGAITRRTAYAERLIPRMGGEPIIGRYVWLKTSDAKVIEEQLLTFVDEYSPYLRDKQNLSESRLSEFYQYKLQSIGDIYFEPIAQEFPNGDMRRVITFAVIGLFVLLAGCSNAISLGLAGALGRRREVGIRKSVGALQTSIAIQYLGESLVLALLSMVPVLLLIQWLSPVFSNLLSIQNLPNLGLQEIGLLLAIATLVGLLNGFYPALVLSKVKPMAVLKTHALQPRLRKFSSRSLLMGGQFSISIVLLVGTLALYAQMYVTRQQPLGFDRENLAQASINFNALMDNINDYSEVLAERLKTVPGIKDTQPVSTSLFATGNRRQFQFVMDQQATTTISAAEENVQWGHFAFMGIPILAGREFESDRDKAPELRAPSQAVSERPPTKVVINRTAMQALGFNAAEEALATVFYRRAETGPSQEHDSYEIIGVVEDSRLNDIRSRPMAEIYLLSATNPLVWFRYEEAIEERLQEVVTEILVEVTGYPGLISYVDDLINQAYFVEQRESRLLLICAALALFLASIGLYGLVSVAMRSQVKEIGVRKVLGANTSTVLATFLQRYSLPVLLANLLAWPVAVYFVLQWIERFPYQLNKTWLLPICLLAGLGVLLIATLTVIGLTWKTAAARPVTSLRDE